MKVSIEGFDFVACDIFFSFNSLTLQKCHRSYRRMNARRAFQNVAIGMGGNCPAMEKADTPLSPRLGEAAHRACKTSTSINPAIACWRGFRAKRKNGSFLGSNI